MALRTLGESQRTVAVRIASNLLSTQASTGSPSASSATPNKLVKSRVLELLDGDMESLLTSLSPSLSTPMKRVASSDSVKVATPSTTKATNPFFLGQSREHSPSGEVVGKSSGTRMDLPQVIKRLPSESTKENVQMLPQQISRSASSTGRPTLYSYKSISPAPAVIYINNEDEANNLVGTLEGPLGFDLEWYVFLRRNTPPVERRTALVQLCDTKTILLVQVSAMKKFPQGVKDVIESPSVVKMGANIRNDGQKLFRDFGILAENLVELGALAHQADPDFSSMYPRPIVSLAKVVERYTGKGLDKGPVRMNNWESVPLTEKQREYASNDAYAALTVYNRLLDMAKVNERVLVPSTYTSNLGTDFKAGNLFKSSATPRVASTVTRAGPSNVYPRANSDEVRPGDPPMLQHMRAYHLWNDSDMALNDICAKLRSEENPLKESTVISYVVKALQVNPSLPFSMERLKTFVQLEAGSWTRHRVWILLREAEKIKEANGCGV